MDRMDSLLEPLRLMWERVVAFLPQLAVAIVVVIAGWLLAKAARFALVKALRAINFNVLTERAGLDGFLQVMSKAPGDAVAYKAWLLQISQSVAEAAEEGGFLGFGGVPVSDAEKATLAEISTALV